jgi:hypothetical protein
MLYNTVYHLRAIMSYIRPNPPIAENSLPLEWEIADDVDFADEDEGVLHEILPICKEIFAEWNCISLLMNIIKN